MTALKNINFTTEKPTLVQVCTRPNLKNIQLSSTAIQCTSSNYTSQGKRKSSACEAISDPRDIERIKEFYLTTGHKSKRKRNYMIFTLGTSIGLRGCDLLRLQIRDIINPDGTIKNRITTFESKTSKMNYPFINNTAKEAIYSYLSEIPAIDFDDYLIKDKPEEKAYKPMCEDTLRKIILKAQQKLNLPYHLGAHSLRKTFSYWTIKLHPNDLNIMNILQEMLNHSSVRTTLRYAGIADEDYNRMYNDIGNFIADPIKATTLPEVNENIFATISNLLDSEE